MDGNPITEQVASESIFWPNAESRANCKTVSGRTRCMHWTYQRRIGVRGRLMRHERQYRDVLAGLQTEQDREVQQA